MSRRGPNDRAVTQCCNVYCCTKAQLCKNIRVHISKQDMTTKVNFTWNMFLSNKPDRAMLGTYRIFDQQSLGPKDEPAQCHARAFTARKHKEVTQMKA